MSKRYLVQRFHYTLKLPKYQWNMISKETLQISNIKTTYNKSFKTKLKVIKVAHLKRQLKKLTRDIYIVKKKQMAHQSLKS